MKIPSDKSPSELAGDVSSLTRHAGWAHLVARHAEQLAAVQAKIDDMTTTPAETQEWKRAREQLLLAHPDALAKDILNTAKNANKRQSI